MIRVAALICKRARMGCAASTQVHVKGGAVRAPATAEMRARRRRLAAATARTRPARSASVRLGGEELTAAGIRTERLYVPVEPAQGACQCFAPEVPQHEAPLLIACPPAQRGQPSTRFPVAIVLHSTGTSKDEPRFREPLERLAARGYVAVGVDSRYHGERGAPGGKQKQLAAYYEALERSWHDARSKRYARAERPFLFDTVHDLRLVLDYLCTREDVDSARIGITGVSLGGMHAWLVAAADERIAALAPMIGVQSFGWALEHAAWGPRVDSLGGAGARPSVFVHAASELARAQYGGGVDSAPVTTDVVRAVWDRIVPGLATEFDAEETLAAIAPRPLLILNGADDPRCPAKGVRAAYEVAAREYAAYGAERNIRLFLEPGVAHQDTPKMWALAEAFLDEHLQPGRGPATPTTTVKPADRV